MLTVPAPAKINLTLEVLGKRPDGYHEIRSVFQTVNLCDTLHFESGQGIAINCDMVRWSADKSLVSQAVDLMREIAGGSRGVNITIEKRIPLMSGFGGDSSDAAAIIRGLSELWSLGLSKEKLLEMATKLGSDVFFFLHGGTAWAGGRGELIEALPSLPQRWVVLVIPDVPREPGKTAAMYAGLSADHYTDGKITEKLVDALKSAGEFKSELLFNTFENIAFSDFTLNRVYVEHIIKLGVPHVHLAGSGPALFTIFEGKTQAEDLYVRCRDQGMEVYLTSTL